MSDCSRRGAASAGEGVHFLVSPLSLLPSSSPSTYSLQHAMAKRTLQRNPDLESALRDAPYDEELWRELERWAVVNDPLRTELVEADGRGEVARDAVCSAARKVLFGPSHVAIRNALSSTSWRAGYLVECRFAVPRRDAIRVFERFVQSPAAALVRDLTMDISEAFLFEGVLAALGQSLAAVGIRSLTVSCLDFSGDYDLDAAWLAPLPRLERLALEGLPPRFRVTSPVAWYALRVVPTDGDELAALLRDALFPRLRELTIDVRRLEREWDAGGTGGTPFQNVEEFFSGRPTPELEALIVSASSARTRRALLDALATSRLLPQLRRISLGHQTFPAAVLRSTYGSAFDHLDILRLPHAPSQGHP